MKYVTVKGVAAGLLVAVVASVCIRLGFWQLERLAERRAHNAELAAAMAAPVLSLQGDVLAAVRSDPGRFRYRRVRVEGVYDARGTALLRGRARQGAPGVHLITPLRIGGSSLAVLVDRGWLPAPDAATADPRPYEVARPTTVEGMIHILPSGSDADVRAAPARFGDLTVPTYQRLALTTQRAAYPRELLPIYVVRSTAGEQEPPFGAPPPRLDEGPHLGYAMQWFGFAAVAVIGFGAVAARAWRRV